MVRPSPRTLLACLLPLAATFAVHADENDVFNLRAAVNVVNDDNLFRTSSAVGKVRSDTITSTVVGVDFNKQLSLQQLVGSISLVNNRYASNDYLNANALQYDARWLWAVGSHLRGEVAIDRSEAQNSFADSEFQRQRNLRTTEGQRFSLDYGVNPSWHVIGGVYHQEMTNERQLSAESDLEMTGAHAGIKYVSAAGNSISWQAKQSEGNYRNRSFDPVKKLDNEFTQPAQEFSINWRLTGHSTVTGRLEYLERKHAHFAERDYSGWAGQLSYLYAYSGKTTLGATYLRNLSAFQDTTLTPGNTLASGTSYYISDELLFTTQWAATGKISVLGRLGFSQRQYRGSISGVPTSNREDQGTRLGVDVLYQAARWLDLKAGIAAEKRDSNLRGFDYTDRQILLSAAARF